MKKLGHFSIAMVIIATACSPKVHEKKQNTNSFDAKVDYAVLMGETVLKKYPNLWEIEGGKEPKWSYTYGLMGLSMLKLWETTGNQAYFNYAKAYTDALIDENGKIKTYKTKEYNLDQINSGKMLFALYEKTADPKYKTAMDTLRAQLKGHPRTEIGGFWHKKRYPHQMWLDGVYMAAPFYAQYSQVYNQLEYFDEISNWIINVEKVTRNEETGLLYHAWDESKEQAWANQVTGCSPQVWGRAMGWYAMALVDVLDYFPKNHPNYEKIVAIINRLAESIIKYQDEDTGVWYQVIDQGTREGNYLEGSVSTMFSYFLLKAINLGYIDKETYIESAKRAYIGTINTLTYIDTDSMLVISPVCAVAGLGGNPYRDGSYEYYVNEKLRDNDPKAVGPFILAAIEYKKLEK